MPEETTTTCIPPEIRNLTSYKMHAVIIRDLDEPDEAPAGTGKLIGAPTKHFVGWDQGDGYYDHKFFSSRIISQDNPSGDHGDSKIVCVAEYGQMTPNGAGDYTCWTFFATAWDEDGNPTRYSSMPVCKDGHEEHDPDAYVKLWTASPYTGTWCYWSTNTGTTPIDTGTGPWGNYTRQPDVEPPIDPPMETLTFSSGPCGAHPPTDSAWVYTHLFYQDMDTTWSEDVSGSGTTMSWTTNRQLKITKTFTAKGQECKYIRVHAKEAMPIE